MSLSTFAATVTNVRTDARGTGVPCGNSWIPRSKKCSKDKARTTSSEMRQRGAQKTREYNKLRAEVKRSAGMKPTTKQSKTSPSVDRYGDLLTDRAFAKTTFEDFGITDDILASEEKIKSFYRSMAKQFHPDKGGTQEQMANLGRLKDQMDVMYRMNQSLVNPPPKTRSPRRKKGERLQDRVEYVGKLKKSRKDAIKARIDSLKAVLDVY